jgi:uncharacterized membrane protein YdjX (TVP38/TMEM64 family)
VKAFWTFLTEMEAHTARTVWVSLALFGVATLVLVVGSSYVELDQGVVTQVLHELRAAWWSPAFVTGIFTVLAFVGAPQIALIAATVAVFGSGMGIILSWVATMISAGVGFYLGKLGGKSTLDRLGSGFVQRMIETIRKNGFLAAAIIRLVPSGPFIMVNMAMGAAGMRGFWYFGGTGIGIVPKIIVIALAGHGMDELFTGDNVWALVFLAAAAAVWLVIVFVVRPMVRAGRSAPSQTPPSSSDSAPPP